MEQHFLKYPNSDTIAGILYKQWLKEPLFIQNPKIQARETFGNGWGFIALQDINQSELIEFARGVNLELRDSSQKDKILHKHLWKNPMGDLPACHCLDCKSLGHLFYLFGGNLSFYNRAKKESDANITFSVIENAHEKILWKDNYPPTPCHLGIVYANREIKAGEEIFIYYGDRYDSNPELLKKIPHIEIKSTMYPPNIRLWSDSNPHGASYIQPDGTTLIPPDSDPAKIFNRQQKNESMNDGSVPKDLDLQKLLAGGLNRVDVNK
jgi:hypothetical protein